MNVALPGLAGLGWPEVIIILLVVLLLFGGKKLPEMARGTGRALRIFKAETKGLMDDDDDDKPATETPVQLSSGPVVQPQPVQQAWPQQPQPAQQPWPQQQPLQGSSGQGQPPVQQQWPDQSAAAPQQWTQQPVQPAPVDEPPRSDTPR
jgi:sec-independent protein translocase protein TatA